MEKLAFIETDNKERLAKYFFDKAINFSLKREYGKAYEFFKQSLDLVTCDCIFKNWDLKITEIDKSIFSDLDNSNSSHTEYLFLKSVLITYSNKLKNPHIGLDAIESYIEKENDEYGYYIKGKLLQKLNKKKEALENYYLSHEINESSKTFYRIGRIKEQFLSQYGLDFLYFALIKNSSSSCCAKELKVYYNKSSLIINDIQSSSELWISFINKQSNPIIFWLQYSRIVKAQIADDKTINLLNLEAIKDFNTSLKKIENIILQEDELDIEDYYDYEYHYSEDSNSVFDNEFYNDALDMDQQSPEFWDNL